MHVENVEVQYNMNESEINRVMRILTKDFHIISDIETYNAVEKELSKVRINRK
jgi:hypothetical protein